jgi:hypothetical protein
MTSILFCDDAHVEQVRDGGSQRLLAVVGGGDYAHGAGICYRHPFALHMHRSAVYRVHQGEAGVPREQVDVVNEDDTSLLSQEPGLEHHLAGGQRLLQVDAAEQLFIGYVLRDDLGSSSGVCSGEGMD